MKRFFNTAFAVVISGLVLIGVNAMVARATVGTVPIIGPALQDGTWLNGLAGGQNFAFQSGLTALGTTQATSLQLASGSYLMETDTVASGTGVALPACLAGTAINLYNNGANTLTVFPLIANNPITAAQDTINNTTSFSITSHVSGIFFCAKNGVWAAK